MPSSALIVTRNVLVGLALQYWSIAVVLPQPFSPMIIFTPPKRAVQFRCARSRAEMAITNWGVGSTFQKVCSISKPITDAIAMK